MNRTRSSCTTSVLALLLALLSSAGQAQPACAPQDEGEQVDDHRLLRQLSLDLLGRIPTMAEWESLEAGASIDEVLLPEMQQSNAYFARIREQHRALLWGNLDATANIGPNTFVIGRLSSGLWRVGNMKRRYRGAITMDCLDEPQPADAYDDDGRPIPLEVISGAEAVAAGCDPADGLNGDEPRECRREGYVNVRPYWDPSTEIKVCAYDAQTLTTDSVGRSCSVFNSNAWCGCGPSLRHCNTGATYAPGSQPPIRQALEEEPARIFEAVIRDRRPYLDAFTTEESYANGASLHFYRNLSGAYSHRVGGALSYDAQMGELPSAPFRDEEWRRVERGDAHAGVLTTLAYLVRFASNRARANRFYTAFRCEPFVPPAEGLPEDTSETPDPNLRQRVGCATCHSRLEPLAAHWGRWRGNGTHGFLESEILSPLEPESSCMGCGGDGQRNCAAFCNAYFVTGANSAVSMLPEWEGLPLARAFLSEEEAQVIEDGPAALVDEDSERARVAACTVRTVAERLYGRQLTQRESVAWVPEMAGWFADNEYDYSALVREIVQGETYRTIR